MAGTTWMAEEPVPITATRCPAGDQAGSHRAVCMTVPPKSRRPGISGRDGSASAPVAAIRYRALNSPWLVVTCQRWVPSSQRAAVTSCPNRMAGSSPYRSATPRRYAASSGWDG